MTEERHADIETVAVPNGIVRPIAIEKFSASPISIQDGGRVLATIYPDGRVEYDPADLDEAASRFWAALSHVVASAHEAECPECGATIRARMADR